MDGVSNSSPQAAEPRWPVLDRYLAGLASEAERVSVEEWLAADVHERAEILALRAVLAAPEREERPERAAHVQALALRALHDREERRELGKSERGVRRDLLRGWPSRPRAFSKQMVRGTFFSKQSLQRVVTAGLIGFAGAALIRVVVEHLGQSGATSTPTSVYTTLPGRRTMITFNGDTRMVLGPATTVRVTADVHGEICATVSGQVLFAVTPSGARALVVLTENSMTRVLGTTFTVRHYPTERVTRVGVVDGRVSVQGAPRDGMQQASATLAAHMLGAIDDSGDVAVTRNVVAADLTAWTEGRLVFTDVEARDVVAELARAYGADIRLADSSFAVRRLTLTVPTNTLSLDGALDVVMLMLDAHATRSGRVITIAPGRPPSLRRSRQTHPFTQESQYGK